MEEKFNQDFHILFDKEFSVLFYIPSLSFYKLKENSISLLTDYKKREMIFNDIHNKFTKGLPNTNMDEENFKRLRKVVLLVEQNCNMSCKYCYANEGKYDLKHSLSMKAEDLLPAFELLLKEFPEGIESVQFFGGEPLLNFQFIEEAVDLISRICEKENVIIPKFGIITNGTIISSRIKEFFNAHNFGVTVSLDGPAKINDLQRILRNGEGSFGLISRNIDYLSKNRKFNLFVEITVTKKHLSLYTTKEDIIEFIDAFAQKGFDAFTLGFAADFPEEYGLTIDDLEKFREFMKYIIDYSIDSMFTDKPFILYAVYFLISKLTKKNKTVYPCRAGLRNFTVTAEGKILPCYLFAGNKSLEVNSNNKNENKGESISIKDIVNKFKVENITSAIEECSCCWIRNLCFSRCPGFSNILYNDIKKPNKLYCEYGKLVVERVLVKLSMYSSNHEKMQILNHNMKFFGSIKGAMNFE